MNQTSNRTSKQIKKSHLIIVGISCLILGGIIGGYLNSGPSESEIAPHTHPPNDTTSIGGTDSAQPGTTEHSHTHTHDGITHEHNATTEPAIFPEYLSYRASKAMFYRHQILEECWDTTPERISEAKLTHCGEHIAEAIDDSYYDGGFDWEENYEMITEAIIKEDENRLCQLVFYPATSESENMPESNIDDSRCVPERMESLYGRYLAVFSCWLTDWIMGDKTVQPPDNLEQCIELETGLGIDDMGYDWENKKDAVTEALNQSLEFDSHKPIYMLLSQP